jgi:hypothetical protein
MVLVSCFHRVYCYMAQLQGRTSEKYNELMVFLKYNELMVFLKYNELMVFF